MVTQHPFNGPSSGTTRVSQYQNGKTNLNLLEQETESGSGISWAITDYYKLLTSHHRENSPFTSAATTATASNVNDSEVVS